MNIKNGAQAPAGSACQNSAQRYLFTIAPALPELALLIVIEVALWTV